MRTPVDRLKADSVVPVGVTGLHAFLQTLVQMVTQFGETGGFDVIPQLGVDKVDHFVVLAAFLLGGIAMLIQ